jgi:DNA-binding response OmpR family regulator
MKKRILVIDDDEAIREALHYCLEDLGYEVKSDTRGEHTSFHVTSFNPHVLILDVMLSGIDGRTIAHNLRNDPASRDLPIIMISAHPDIEPTLKPLGVSAFFAKPFGFEELSETLTAVLSE